MVKTTTSDLSFPRLFALGPASHTSNPFPALCDQFENATGWVLSYRPASNTNSNGSDDSAKRIGVLEITDMSAEWLAKKPTASREKCDRLVESLNEIIQKLALSNSDSSAACASKTKSPSATKASSSKPLSTSQLGRLISSLLPNAMELGQGHSAVIYLLDEQASELKARAVLGKAVKLGQIRSLAASMADVTAMAGAAIVMDCELEAESWDAPARCSSAVCIPIASSSTVFGTLWVFRNHEADCDSWTLNLLEIIAGRLGAEMELDALSRTIAPANTVNTANANCLETGVELGAESGAELGEASGEGPCSAWGPVDLPFDGWNADMKQASCGFTRWWVNQNEQVVAICGRSRDTTAETEVIINAAQQASEFVDCSAMELYEAMQILLGAEWVEDDLEMVCVMIDPLSGEVQIAGSESTGEMNISVYGGDERVAIQGDYVGFLSRGQSLIVGGESAEHEMLNTKTPDLQSLLSMLDGASGRAGGPSLSASHGRLIISRSS